MTLLFENPLPIWTTGTVILTLCLIIFLARRSLGALLAMVGVIVVTLLLVFIERLIITSSEEVELSLASLMNSIEANDLPAVLALIDPAAKNVRSDAEMLLPQVKVKQTDSTTIQVEVDQTAVPLRATSHFRGRIDGTHSRTGARIFYFDQVEIDWQRTGDHWLIIDYRAKFRGKPINPVDSFQNGRAIR